VSKTETLLSCQGHVVALTFYFLGWQNFAKISTGSSRLGASNKVRWFRVSVFSPVVIYVLRTMQVTVIVTIEHE